MKNTLITLLLIVQCLFNVSLIQAQDRIVGGFDSEINDYPWQAALVDPYGSGYCGASIISNQWILTAAHCIEDSYSPDVFVRVGSENSYSYGGVTYSVSEIIVHPNYTDVTSGSDIALIKLSDTIIFNHNIQPIGLISPD